VNHRNRRASSLIELMVLVSTTSIMLLVTIGFIHRTLAWSKEVALISDELRINQQLSLRFVQDVHDAVSVEISSESELKLTQPQQVILYQIEGNKVTRQQSSSSSNTVAEIGQAPLPKDHFVYPLDRILRFTQGEAENCVRLQLLQTAIDFEQPKAMWTIEGYSKPQASGEKQ
jgi:hypothetical protein